MKRQDILIFNQHASYITIDIANAMCLSGKYEKVILMTGVVNERETTLNESIDVIKTLKYNKRNILTRFISWLFSFLHFLIVVKFKYRNAKLFLISNPPLIAFTPYFCKNNFSTLIFDVYPDALMARGFIKENSFISKFWSKANVNLFNKSEKVFTISEGMRESLIRYCDSDKIEVVNLWGSFDAIIIEREKNVFISQMGLIDKFIIMYSGNMGKGCGLESIIEVADKLKIYKDIVFLFVGEGWALNDLKLLVDKKSIDNCIFLPYQPASILKHSLSAANISVISLPPDANSISIPNKTYTLLALGLPLLCIADSCSDLGKMIVKYKPGELFHINDIDKMVDYILLLRSNKEVLQEYSKNSLVTSGYYQKSNSELFV